MSSPYAGYVLAAYLITAAVVASLVAWIWLDRRAAQRSLVRAERASRQAEPAGHADTGREAGNAR